jgi:hypothetical protein
VYLRRPVRPPGSAENRNELHDPVGDAIAESVAFILLLETTSMLAKAAALWLAVLILLPFSAPFSTCDLASLVSETDQAAGTPHHGPAVGDGAAFHALPFVRAASRLKVFTASPFGSRALAVMRPPAQPPRVVAAVPAGSSVSTIPLRI